LLDHQLYGNIYNSIILDFFAILGIKENDGRAVIAQSFYKATTYTAYLSAFVKMAQLLVVQRAVLAVELDHVDHPADILNTMEDRFMAYGTRSPIN
jgi:hypothetical protein